jgi:hypothetical protein
MKNQTYLSALWQRKWAIFVVLLCLSLMTIGLPTNANTGDWEFHSIWDIDNPRITFGAFVFLVVFAAACLLQVRNEWKRSNGGNVKLK